jgi:hypothetical protein
MSVNDDVLRKMLQEGSAELKDIFLPLAKVERGYVKDRKNDAAQAQEHKEWELKETLYEILKAYLTSVKQTFKTQVMDRIMESPKIKDALEAITKAAYGFQCKRFKTDEAVDERDAVFFWKVREIIEVYFEMVKPEPVETRGEGGKAQDTESEEEAGEGSGGDEGHAQVAQDFRPDAEAGEAGDEDQGQVPDGEGAAGASDNGPDAGVDAGVGGPVILDLTEQPDDVPVADPVQVLVVDLSNDPDE